MHVFRLRVKKNRATNQTKARVCWWVMSPNQVLTDTTSSALTIGTTARVLNDSYQDVTKEQTIIVLRWDWIIFLGMIFFLTLRMCMFCFWWAIACGRFFLYSQAQDQESGKHLLDFSFFMAPLVQFFSAVFVVREAFLFCPLGLDAESIVRSNSYSSP